MTAEKPSALFEHRRRLQALGQVTAAVAHEGKDVLLSKQVTLGRLADAILTDQARSPGRALATTGRCCPSRRRPTSSACPARSLARTPAGTRLPDPP